MLAMLKTLNKKQGERLSFFLPFGLSFLSGIAMGITVAPVGAWFFAWFALAPLWVLVVKSTRKKISHPILLGFTWAIGYHGVALAWITGIHPMDWLGVPWWPSLAITLFCWTFISCWGGILVGLWAGLMARLTQQKPVLRVLMGTALWCALESLWSAGPLWWSSLAYTQSPQNLVILHLGQISGTTTITALIVAINGLIAEFWINRHSRKKLSYLAAACVIFIISHLIGFYLYTQPLQDNPSTALKIGIIQGNIPNKIKLLPEGLRRAITGYTEGYEKLATQGVDGILTPEGALPFFQRDLKNTPLLAAVREKGVIVWVGAFGERGKSYTNSLFTVAGNGEIISRYDKSKLVPLGEYIPFEQIIGGLIQRLSPLDEHQVHGASNQIFDTPLGRVIVGICYESAFPEIFRRQAAAGGQFILSSSNDAHYTAAMSAQHHAQDIMRAIETDRWAVRATNTGYSAFVNPHGKTLWISGYNTYETHTETIYRRPTQTLYVRWGDWLMPLLLIASTLAWVAARTISDEQT
ncbi:apolipoprotein N-acyltransferase [Richelia sinica FACHB-800]|uniref:Apolipoprotein N-acyltransferase n=2 Tax=Richelia TaxID=98443 RepID=A0A975TAS1_9NOST|nr:apolipoprotein N-acyltransferase [Richelia sinica FACHB-800]QXE25040.1 apolipoprotein N-acyltransferase [Richelia sinica FACHB-800]